MPGVPPPLTIKLPTGWQFAYQIVPIHEPLVEATMNMAFYTGPLSNGGKATIIVLWGFPSIGPPPTLPGAVPAAGTAAPGPPANGPTPLDYQSQMLWSDGLRLLQGTVLDISCNVGRYDQRAFMVGGKVGVGAYYNASQCPDAPDTVGWFAGLNQFGGNYLFYVYIDPITAYNDGRGELQKILDTVVFRAPVPVTSQTPGSTQVGPPPTNTPGR